MLCKKVVNFFSLLSHTHETGARKMSITQELLSLVTGLAHYLKILIRIALTAALKLEREYVNMTAIGHFLSRLDRLARDPEASKFTPAAIQPSPTGGEVVKARAYGYKSLRRAVGTLVGQGEATTDLCEGCRLTVEEECARFGTSLRWHLPCLRCVNCGKAASKEREGVPETEGQPEVVYLKEFRIEPVLGEEGRGPRLKGGQTFCAACGPEEGREGFEYVTRLEQYAFLLCVALNKLYALLKQRGVVPSSPGAFLFLVRVILALTWTLRSRHRRRLGGGWGANTLRRLPRFDRHQAHEVRQPRPQALLDNSTDTEAVDRHPEPDRSRRPAHRLLHPSPPLRQAPRPLSERPTPRRHRPRNHPSST